MRVVVFFDFESPGSDPSCPKYDISCMSAMYLPQDKKTIILKKTQRYCWERFDMFPVAAECPDDVYNLWKGFAAEKMTIHDPERARDPRSATGFGSFGGRWWLHKLGEQQRRRQLVAMAANVRVVATVLARPPLSRFEAAERRSSGLDGIDGQCLRRMILPSSNGSCSRLPDSIRTLGGCVRTYATRRTRAYAAEVVAWPL